MAENAENIEPTPAEELRFILQASVAPVSIARRMMAEGTPFYSALRQTVDRSAYVKHLRLRQKAKGPAAVA